MTTDEFDNLSPEELIEELSEELEPNGDIDKIRKIIAAGCDLNTEMLILAAVNTGRLEIVRLLVDAGADVNQMDLEDFETALFRAKYRGFQDIAEYLEPLTDPKIREIVEEMIRQNQPKKSKKQKG